MIKRVKVSAQAVNKYNQSIIQVHECSIGFEKGVLCLEQLIEKINSSSGSLEKKCVEMKNTQKELEEKIKNLEDIVYKLTAQIEGLESELSSLESELSFVEASISMTNSEGEEYEIPNPEYERLVSEIDQLESEISALRRELQPYQQRLEHAYSVNNNLSAHIDSIEGVIFSLREKNNECKQLISKINEVKNSVKSKCVEATSKLSSIERVINEYVHVKMPYAQQEISSVYRPVSNVNSINVNINVNKTYNGEKSYSDLKKNDEINTNEIPETKEKYLDDNGTVYRTRDSLIPNMNFRVKGYDYKTDDKGRLISAEGKLRLRDPDYDRNMEDIRRIDSQEYRTNDDKGHLIAHRFGGSDTLANLVPMNKQLNQFDYKKMEDYLEDCVENGADVVLKVEPIYENASTRPTEFKVTNIIDGEKEVIIFKNESEAA